MSREDYRPFVPAPGKSRIAGETPHEHAKARLVNPRARELFDTWAQLSEAPFKGVTTDGNVQPGLFSLQPSGAPADAMTAAASALMTLLSSQQRTAACLPVGSTLWQQWQNTEILVEHHGLRQA